MQFDKRYNRTEFVSFLKNNFLPEDFVTETAVIPSVQSMAYTSGITKLGACESLDLVVYEIRHKSKHDARVGLSKEAFRFLADEWENRALVVFVPEDNDDNYRFSLITIDLEETESGRIAKRYSNPRRYSYFLGKGIAYHTPNKYLNEKGRVKERTENGKQISAFEDLRNRFSVEVLTEAFYSELSDWYAWAVKTVRFPNKLDDTTDDDKFNAEATIRLVTRLIFVWFLKQKHLIPDEFFDEEYIADHLLKNFCPNEVVNLFGKSEESVYYKAILQNLFFAMLNSPITPEGKDTISERRFRNGRSDYDNNKLMRYESLFTDPDLFVNIANRTVPFLNGGLFDCLDDKDNHNYIDGFSDREVVQKALIVPDYLFFGEEVGKNIDLSEWYGDNTKKKVSARGIIDILKRYNFTVEENTPFDQEVSLDPELLGKVFENLLASYNPETQTTARKQTGSFYTPREIVQYMVDESIIAHLCKHVSPDLETEYRKLMAYNDEMPNLDDKQKEDIINAIFNCKILDPACGSGAFPMGILQQMVHVLSQLDPTNEKWKNLMLENALGETKDAFKSQTEEERAEKLRDIENSFNENLNNPDYARKLYLVENCIYGVDIQPIAIQISKLRFFISLVVDQKSNNNPVDNFGIRPLPNLEAKFVAANSLLGLNTEDTSLFTTEEIREIEKQLQIANHKIFSAKTYRTKRKYRDLLKELRQQMVSKLAEMNAIGDAQMEQLASWDMFNQNACASFFDPEWMFGVKEGFDIVIGNPPYISTKGVDVKSKKLYEKEFGFSDDTYNLFTFKGLSLTKEGGSLTYIIPKTFWTTGTKRNMRDLILGKKLRYIFDTANPFRVVMVDTCIMQVVNEPYESSHTIRFLDGSQDLFVPCEYPLVKQEVYINTQNSAIFKPSEYNMKIWNLYGEKVKNLYNQWWDKIETSRKISQNERILKEYRESLKPGDVALLGCLTEGGQGLATANNGKYVAVRRSTKWADNIVASRYKKLADAVFKYKITARELNGKTPEEFLATSSEYEIAEVFDALKERYGRDIFGQGYLYKIIEEAQMADVDSLTDDEKENGIDSSKNYWVPYDKGDKDGNRWYLETPFAIAWSKENVHFLKTDSKARYQGYTFFFKEGLCWSDINTTYLKCRKKDKSINDVKSMSLYGMIETIPEYYIISLINSTFMSYYVDSYVNNTQTFQINDARQLPIVVPNSRQLYEIKSVFDRAIELKKAHASEDQLSEIQEQLDRYIMQLYHL